MKNIICIPYAYEAEKNTGLNLNSRDIFQNRGGIEQKTYTS